ncbi:tripartite tricarboxylate transporter substrate binding protein [Pigmentiphaga soli]
MKPDVPKTTTARHSRAAGTLAGLALLAACAGAFAQAYPVRPVQIIVPFPPGGSLDALVRTVAQQMGERWNVPVVVDNRAGASGMIGLNAAAKAAPDGYTLAAVANSFVANTLLRQDMPYDAFKDFAAVSLLGSVPFVVTASTGLPVNSVRELADYSKRQPGRLTYSSGGTGTMSHLGGEMFKRATGIEATHVPYRGQAPALTDVVAGQVSFTMGNLPEVLPYAQAGKVKTLAILTASRSALRPDIPTLKEAGYAQLETGSWYGLVAPAGTPPAVVGKIQETVAAILRQPAVHDKLVQQGFEVVGNTPAEFGAFMRDEAAAYRKVIDAAGIKTE